MAEHPISGMMDTTLQHIREMVDASTVIGEPVIQGDTIVIPVSKISYGFASGGSDLPTKMQKDCFGGGGGAGVTVSPVAFLVIRDGEVKILQVEQYQSPTDRALALIPDVIEKIRGFFSKKKDGEDKADKPEDKAPKADINLDF